MAVGVEAGKEFLLDGEGAVPGRNPTFGFPSLLSQVSVVNQLDMQVIVSNVPPTLVEQNKDQLIG